MLAKEKFYGFQAIVEFSRFEIFVCPFMTDNLIQAELTERWKIRFSV